MDRRTAISLVNNLILHAHDIGRYNSANGSEVALLDDRHGQPPAERADPLPPNAIMVPRDASSPEIRPSSKTRS